MPALRFADRFCRFPRAVKVLWTFFVWSVCCTMAVAQLEILPDLPTRFVGPEEGPFEGRYGVVRDSLQSAPALVSSSTASTKTASATSLMRSPSRLDRELLEPSKMVRSRQTGMLREVRLVQNEGRHGLLRIEVDHGHLQARVVQAMAGEHVLVRLRPGVTAATALALTRAAGVERLEAVGSGGLFRAHLLESSVEAVPRALAALGATPALFVYAEPDYLITVESVNDTLYDELWGLNNIGQTGGTTNADINAPEAWQVTTGSRNILVGVIDTGIDFSHPDLAANIWTNPGEIPGNGIDDDGNGYIDDVHGYNFAYKTSNPMDDHRHGTHVAGTIGAAANNQMGVVGVAHQVSLVAIKFLSSNGSGMTSDAALAIEYATSIGCDITNNSWGGGQNSQALRDAMQGARDAGVITVVAAGNGSANLDFALDYPASYSNLYDNMVVVAATNDRDGLASFSNHGPSRVHVGAPGVGILSTFPSNRYSQLDGTSMAAPHVTGALVLLKVHFPELSYSQLINRLLGTVTPLPSLLGKTQTSGRIDAYRALTYPAPEFLTLRNTTADTVTWSTASAVPWLTLAIEGGQLGPHESILLELSVNAAGSALPTGDYTGEFTLVATDSQETATLHRRVYLTVTPFEGGRLQISPATPIESSGAVGGQVQPASYTYTLLNPGNSPIDVSAAGTQPWLSLPASSFHIPAGGSRTLTVNIAANTLDTGIYNGKLNVVNVTNGRGNLQINANLQIVESGVMTISPLGGLSSMGNAGGPFEPSTAAYTIYNNGTSPILWSVDANVPWVFLSRSQGQLAAGDSTEIIVSLNSLANNLPRGDHVAALRFSNLSTGLGTTSRFISVIVVVPPTLNVTPTTSFSTEGLVGGPFTPTTATYSVSNAGDLSLLWMATVDVPWLSLSAYQGTLDPNAGQVVTATLTGQVASLPAGVHTGRITLTNGTNNRGSTYRLVSLRIMRPANLTVFPPENLQARGMVGGRPVPVSKSYTCTNSGDQTLELTVSVNRPWLTASQQPPMATFMIAGGESVEVELAIGDISGLEAGDHAGALSFTNVTNGAGDTQREATLDLKALAKHLIYSVSVRGARYGTSTESINRSGYLLIDRANQLMSAVLGWVDGSSRQRVYQVQTLSGERAITYRFDVGSQAYEGLTMLTTSSSADALLEVETQQLLGQVQRNLDIGGSTLEDAPPQFTGTDYLSSAQGSQIGISTLTARLLLADTRLVNEAEKSHDAVVDEYALAVAGMGFTPLSLAPAAPPPAAAATESAPVLMYSSAMTLNEYSDPGNESFSRSGYMFVGPQSNEVILLSLWQQNGQKVFDRTSWSQRQVQSYMLTTGNSRHHVLDILSSDAEQESATLYRLNGSVVRGVWIGGVHVTDVAPQLSGQIRTDDQLARLYGTGTLSATYNHPYTLSFNGRNLSVVAAVEEVELLLVNLGWQPAQDDAADKPGR